MISIVEDYTGQRAEVRKPHVDNHAIMTIYKTAGGDDFELFR